MAEIPRPQEAKDELEKPETPKVSKGLAGYLLRRRQEMFNSERSDDDSETEDKPKKRWRKLFKSVFPSIVERPESSNRERRSWFMPEVVVQASTEMPKEPEGSRPEDIRSEYAPRALPNTETYATYDTPLPGIEPAPAELEVTVEHAGPAHDRAEAIPVIENSVETSQDIPGNQTPEQVAPEEAPALEQQVYGRLYERQNATTSQEREVVIERGVGSALPVALVVAEHFIAKGRDKKLDKKFTTQNQEIRKDVAREQFSRSQLETLVKQNREQLENLKSQRQGVERPVAARQERKLDTKQSSELIASRMEPAHQVEQKVSAAEQAGNNRNQPEARAYSASMPERRQERLMKEVAEAAEVNAPVERSFERSHEIKDDLPVSSAAASVGSVMASKLAAQQAAQASQYAQPTQASYDNSGLPVIDDPKYAAAMYQQAMKFGLVTAVVIIIFGILAYLMVK